METAGRITEPKTGDSINRVISVLGEIDEFPPGYHFWLAVGKKSGSIWLKDPEITAKFWRIDIDYGNPTEDFSFLLLAVGEEGQCTIKSWFRFGKVTQSYPGLRLEDIPTAIRIDIVERLGLRLR